MSLVDPVHLADELTDKSRQGGAECGRCGVIGAECGRPGGGHPRGENGRAVSYRE